MKKFLTSMLATLAVVILGGFTRVSAADPKPYFNYYNNVPNIGSEADFLRVSQVGANNFTNNVEACTDGQEVTVRVYIHNGAEPELNGTNLDGPGVSLNTKLAINVPQSTSPGTLNAVITSSNAANSGITDTASVTCNGQIMDLTYVPGSAVIKNTVQNYVGLNDNVFKGGTPIGYSGQDGKMPGCWEYVTYVYAKVKVTKKPVEVKPTAVCVLDKGAFNVDRKNRKVTFAVATPAVSGGATGTGKYRIDWGDGTSSAKQSDSHTYKEDKKYIITGYAEVDVPGAGKKYISSSDCVKEVEFKPETITVTTVEKPKSGKLVETGAGNIFGIFSATTIAGAFMHRVYNLRKTKQL